MGYLEHIGTVWARPTLKDVYLYNTFESRLQHRSWFGGQQDTSGIFDQCPTLLAGDDELANEARAVPDIIVLIILAQIQDILCQQFGLNQQNERFEKQMNN